MRKRRWGKPRTEQSKARAGEKVSVMTWVTVALSSLSFISVFAITTAHYGADESQDKAIIAVQLEAGDALQARIAELQAELTRRNKAYESCVETAAYMMERIECLESR